MNRVSVVGSVVAILLVGAFPRAPATASITNVLPDFGWNSQDGAKRENENCGTIAIANLLRQWDNSHDRLVENNFEDLDHLKDAVERNLRAVKTPKADGSIDMTVTGDSEAVRVLNRKLAEGGYKGTAECAIGSKLNWAWLVDQWKQKEKIMVLLKTANDVGHWVTVIDVDATNGKLSVSDPNTSNNSPDINTPGGKDEYSVDTSKLEFDLKYDFAGETHVKIISAVKLSDVTNNTCRKASASVGAKGGASMSYDPASRTLSFSPSTIDTADQQGGLAGGIDLRYLDDPILGATMMITPLVLDTFVEDVPLQGALFSGGALQISKDAVVLLNATFDRFTMFDNADLTITSCQAILDEVYVNPDVESRWLTDFWQRVVDSNGWYYPDFYGETLLPGGSLLSQFGFFQSASPVTVDVQLSLCGNPAVPEPASWIVWGLGAAIVAAISHSKRRKRPTT